MQAVRPRPVGAPGRTFQGGAGDARHASGGLIHRRCSMLFRSRVTISAFLMVVAAPFASAQPFSELAADDSPSRHQRLVEAAQKEGSLTVYTSNAAPTIQVLSADFERRYGIRVNAWRASSAKVLQRAVAEKRANRWDFDAVSVSSPELEALVRENLLQEINSGWHKEMLEGTLPAHRGWAPQFINVFVQAYNPRAVGKQDLPKRWAENVDELRSPTSMGRQGAFQHLLVPA